MKAALPPARDGALYLSAYSGDYSTLYRLTYNADTNVYEAMGMGTYGNKVCRELRAIQKAALEG